MAGIGVWLEGEGTIVVPLILMGVEVDDGGAPIRDYYYTIWDHGEVGYYTDRLHTLMGWDADTPLDERALEMAKRGAGLLRREYIKLWDIWYPTLYLYTRGCHPRRRMREKVRDMRLPPPFITRKPYRR